MSLGAQTPPPETESPTLVTRPCVESVARYDVVFQALPVSAPGKTKLPPCWNSPLLAVPRLVPLIVWLPLPRKLPASTRLLAMLALPPIEVSPPDCESALAPIVSSVLLMVVAPAIVIVPPIEVLPSTVSAPLMVPCPHAVRSPPIVPLPLMLKYWRASHCVPPPALNEKIPLSLGAETLTGWPWRFETQL